MINCSVQEIAQAVQGTILQNSEASINAVTTDSRSVAEGQLFIPLVGEKFDGHAYIDMALNKGASGCLTQKSIENYIDGKFYIAVEDTLVAYKLLAKWYREKFSIPVVQITGSAGKTTTKEMIASVLSVKYRTLKTEANYNNAIGTPRTLLNLLPEHEAAVIETGMNHFGEIRYLGEMVQPDMAVITNVGDAHIENLGGTREGTLKAKSEIFEHLKKNGTAIINGDDQLLSTLDLPFETARCGVGENCNVRVSDIQDLGINGLTCCISTENQKYQIGITSPGAYMIYPAAMAVKVGEILGLSVQEIEEGIRNYQPTGARMHIIRDDMKRIIIDDCYNANPQSMEEAIRLLAKTASLHRVAVLGDMGELGELSEKAHRDLGILTKELGIETVIAVGEKSHWIAEENEIVQYYKTLDEAITAVQSVFVEDTTILVKASHAMEFNKIVKELQK